MPLRLIFYLCRPYRTISCQTHHPYNTKNTETWMKDNFNNIPFICLTLPGCHNAHAYYKFNKACSFVVNYAQCQSLNIYQQLKNGSRSLDIRLCKYNNDIWCSHGAYYTVPFSKVILQCVRYINEFPSEIFIVRCQQNNVNYNEAFMVLKEYGLDKYLCPNNRKDVLKFTVNELAKNKWNCVFIFESKFSNYDLKNSWSETNSLYADNLIYKIYKWINNIEYLGYKTQYLQKNHSNNNKNRASIRLSDLDQNKTTCHQNIYPIHLIAAQLTPKPEGLWILYQILNGGYGLKEMCSAVNYHIMHSLSNAEIFKVNILDMDYLHPLIVNKIIDINKEYLFKD